MIAAETTKLSMKTLDERLRVLETEREWDETARPEWFSDVLGGIISALRQLRQQGAYNLANELEAKYAPEGVVVVGDEITSASSLNRTRR